MKILIYLLAIVLVGCATQEQREARLNAERDAMLTKFGETCQRIGYSPGTEKHSDCKMELLKSSMTAAGAQAAGRAAASGAITGAIIQNRTRTCTTTGTSTTCY